MIDFGRPRSVGSGFCVRRTGTAVFYCACVRSLCGSSRAGADVTMNVPMIAVRRTLGVVLVVSSVVTLTSY